MVKKPKYLYTCQSFEVIGILHSDKIYYPSVEKASCFSYDDPSDEVMRAFDVAYKHRLEWLMCKFNQIKKHDFSSAPVWWTDNMNIALDILQHSESSALLRADISRVPEQYLLKLNRDSWDRILGCSYDDSWLGFEDFLESNRPYEEIDAMLDKLSMAYGNNPLACIETWNNALNITKNCKRIEYLTPFIDYYWTTPVKSSNSESVWEV